MTDVVGHVADQEKGPEESEENGVWYYQHSQQSVDADQKRANSQKGRINKTIPK